MTNLSSVERDLEIGYLIDHLQEAQLSQNYELSISLFKDLWDYNEELPDWIEHNLSTRAHLSSLAGSFLLDYGKSKNILNFQERAKDAFTRAIELFLESENTEEAMNCRRLQAFAYYQEGSIREYNSLLEDAESYFDDKSNYVYLRIQANFLLVLISRNEIKEAINRIERVLEYIGRCADLKTMVMFYTNCGIVFRRNGAYQESLDYYEKALTFARVLNNKLYEALITNSLATALAYLKKYDKALKQINIALDLASDFPGHTANFLDTKANIFYKLRDYDAALEFTNQSIEIFQQGDDSAGLAESLWTKTKIHIQQGYASFALETFFDLYQIKLQKEGEKAASKSLYEFCEFIFLIPDTDLKTQTELFKIQQIETALSKEQKITKAANLLGIKPGTLSAMLQSNYRDIIDDFELNRKERSDKK